MVRRVAAVLALVLAAAVPVSAQTPVAGTVEIQGTVTAAGRYVFLWVEDELCTIAIWDYDFAPDLVVYGANGDRLGVVPLGDAPGKVTMEGDHAQTCTVPYSVTVQASGGYRLVLDPYYDSGPLPASAAERPISVSIEREANDPSPDLSLRPAGPIPGTDLYLLAGTLRLVSSDNKISDPDYIASPLGCTGMGGFSDIVPGAKITVRDESGSIVAVAPLEQVVSVNNSDSDALEAMVNDPCLFRFNAEVPEESFYSLTLGRRGGADYSLQDLNDAGWRIDLSIGR